MHARTHARSERLTLHTHGRMLACTHAHTDRHPRRARRERDKYTYPHAQRHEVRAQERRQAEEEREKGDRLRKRKGPRTRQEGRGGRMRRDLGKREVAG